MAVTKTDFINYTRCPRYVALDDIKKERLLGDVSYDEYKSQEENAILEELFSSMYEENEDGEVDKIDKPNRQLEAMMKYYKVVEDEAGKLVEKQFGGKTIYAAETFNQECFDFSLNGIKYICYVDIYNETDMNINIIEVKATTDSKYMKMTGSYYRETPYSIWERKNNINYLKCELSGYDIESEMPLEKIQKQRDKLFDRFGLGKYVYDLAIQRYVIEQEYKQSNNEKSLIKFKYYLAVLNSKYIFDGTYENGEPLYNSDANGNDIITFFDMTEVTYDYQKIINTDREELEKYIFNMNVNPCKLSKACGRKTPSGCKFFDAICAKHIPKYNSSLNYVNNAHGFVSDDGEKIKGLDLINEGYLNMLDIPDSWIKRDNHHIQRDCLRFDKQYIDNDKLKIGLKQIQYPIYHLDFETFPCPVPRYKGEFPYIQSPFEFSLHIEHEPGICDKDLDCVVFLATSHEDERENLIKTLLDNVDVNCGTMFAQNVSFEKGRIKELANIFPEYKSDLMKFQDSGFDLLWLVNTNSKMYEELGYNSEEAKRFNFYDKNLSGSFSIKKTLPVFSDLSYEGMVVANGTEAIVEYANYPLMSKEEYRLKYQGLIDYCKQDTWAMVVILEKLRKLVN